MLSVNSFHNRIDVPTRITPSSDSSETLIDLCLTNFDRNDTRGGEFTSDLSYHLSILCFVPRKLSHVASKSNDSTKIRKMTSESTEHFRQLVGSTNWTLYLRETDPNVLYGKFINKIIELYDIAFPLVILQRSGKIRKPWITKELLPKIKTKNKWFNR